MTTIEMDNLLSVAEAATCLGISRVAVGMAVRRGTLIPIRSRPYLLLRSEVERYRVERRRRTTSGLVAAATAARDWLRWWYSEPITPSPTVEQIIADLDAALGDRGEA